MLDIFSIHKRTQRIVFSFNITLKQTFTLLKNPSGTSGMRNYYYEKADQNVLFNYEKISSSGQLR